jgi:hypothetical protein
MDEERYLQMPTEWGGIIPSEVFVREAIVSRIKKILDHVQKKPKTNRWKLRSIIGARKTWYKSVETTETVGEFHMWRLKEEARK